MIWFRREITYGANIQFEEVIIEMVGITMNCKTFWVIIQGAKPGLILVQEKWTMDILSLSCQIVRTVIWQSYVWNNKMKSNKNISRAFAESAPKGLFVSSIEDPTSKE